MSDKKRDFDEQEEEWITNSIKFMTEARKTCVERGKLYEFKCPICGGKAYASSAKLNGHIHASCKDCEMQIMQ